MKHNRGFLFAARIFPFVVWWPEVNRKTFRVDFLAGIVGALIALPQGMAFAAIAGMPIQYGLYTGMVPAIIAALFGSSWHLVSGPTTAASIVMLSMLGMSAEPGGADYVSLALTLTFMVGIIQVCLGIARMGAVVNFISHSVVVGFTAGAAVLIMVNQVGHLFGLTLPRSIYSYETAHAMLLRLSDIDPAVTVVGALTVVTGLLCKRFLPWIPYMIPAMLAGGVVAFGAEYWLGARIPMAGALPSSLPPLSTPSFSLDLMRQLAPAALAMTLFALTEAATIGRSLAARSGQHLDGNQEFIGQGLSNIVGSFFSAYVATGSFNRSAANYAAGARTPMAAIFAGLFLIAVVMLAAPLGAHLPKAAMAGVLFLVAIDLVDMPRIRGILRISRSETAVLAMTFFCALAFGLEFSILAGVVFSLVIYLARTSHPPVTPRTPDPDNRRRILVTNPELPGCPQLKLVHIEGSLFFGAIHHVRESLRRIEHDSPELRHLAITATRINFIDVAGAEMLVQEARSRQERGGALYLIRPNAGLMTPLRKSGYVDLIGEENIFSNKHEAIATIVSRLDPNICAGCTRRIFLECGPSAHARGSNCNGEDTKNY
uniref:Sulfate permease, SulP family n=1 Tax=Candidatus Kentrum sp. SD TaxID=2126332 RepID=A0A450Y6Y4_9GAMM|nr:MAG: sulfate permease, SulP family [Candidatus Kentron sp. SD]VFK42364.1 MAG: sulfate permease, SulP family [Candidatus Kentron sp. SD]VFK79442.1 MAG: sulfate permease, SulP family [Candidatus Kentron sp. SD]